MTRTPRFRREVAGGLETRVGGNGMKPNMRMVRYQQLATLLSATAERLSTDSATFRAIVEHGHIMGETLAGDQFESTGLKAIWRDIFPDDRSK